MKKNNSKSGMSRRKFLADCGKMSSIGAMSSVLNMNMMGKVLAARAPGSITDYKAVVCLFMFGGNDSFNMLAPWFQNNYNDYSAIRGELALPKETLLPIVDRTDGIKRNGIHPNMPEVKDMFNNGDLSFVANVGTLVEPMNLTEFNNGTKAQPVGISSHFDQQSQWQTSIANERTGSVGWMGRMSDIINDAANNNAVVNMNMAPGGNNTLQQGLLSGPFSLVGGVNTFDLYKSATHIKNSVNSQLEHDYANVLSKHHEHVRNTSIEQSDALGLLEQNTTINTIFPNTKLGAQLLQVAKYIKSQGVSGLNTNRHTFFVSEGGFDMHSNVIRRHGDAMTLISQALNAFNDAMKEIGYHDKVVTYTASDFGRALFSNGHGSDHGWGGNHMVMGGPVEGGRILGTYPDLAEGSDTDTGRGRQLPTTSVDELHASIAQWYGITNDAEMEEIIPNIRNFYARDTNPDNYAIPGLFA